MVSISNLFNVIREGSVLDAIIIILSRAFVVFCCLPIHELAHAWTAYKLGDSTAKYSGRLTFNPLSHLNPIGVIMIFLFGIGYANPVPVNAAKFKNPRRDMALTALAGPASNLLMAFFYVWFYYLFRLIYLGGSNSAFASIIASFFSYAAMVNISLAVFNLIPIPPLDGSKVLAVLIPDSVYFKYLKYEKYFMIAILLLLFTNILSVPLSIVTGWLYKVIAIIPSLVFDLLY